MAARTFSRSSGTLMMMMMMMVAALTFADQTITRRTGTNVTLEFQNPNGITSWWLKRLGSDKYIAYCRDGHPIHTRDREESFQGRVEGVDCDKINGIVSVTLSNLTKNDSGWYEFYGMDRDGRDFNETRLLNVTDEKTRGHYWILAPVFAVVIVVVVVVVASKVCPTSMKEYLQRLLKSALTVAETNDQEVMERAASIPFLGQPQTV